MAGHGNFLRLTNLRLTIGLDCTNLPQRFLLILRLELLKAVGGRSGGQAADSSTMPGFCYDSVSRP